MIYSLFLRPAAIQFSRINRYFVLRFTVYILYHFLAYSPIPFLICEFFVNFSGAFPSPAVTILYHISRKKSILFRKLRKIFCFHRVFHRQTEKFSVKSSKIKKFYGYHMLTRKFFGCIYTRVYVCFFAPIQDFPKTPDYAFIHVFGAFFGLYIKIKTPQSPITPIEAPTRRLETQVSNLYYRAHYARLQGVLARR